MTHSEACNLCQMVREEKGTWKLSGCSWNWIPAPECDYEVVNVLGSYSVQLKRA